MQLSKFGVTCLIVLFLITLVFAIPIYMDYSKAHQMAVQYLHRKYPDIQMDIGRTKITSLIGPSHWYDILVKAYNNSAPIKFRVTVNTKNNNLISDDYLRWALNQDISEKLSKLLVGVIPAADVFPINFIPPEDDKYFLKHSKTNITYDSSTGGLTGVNISWRGSYSIPAGEFVTQSIAGAKRIVSEYKEIKHFVFAYQYTETNENRIDLYINEIDLPIEQLMNKVITVTF